jgi:hypothetical protein
MCIQRDQSPCLLAEVVPATWVRIKKETNVLLDIALAKEFSCRTSVRRGIFRMYCTTGCMPQLMVILWHLTIFKRWLVVGSNSIQDAENWNHAQLWNCDLCVSRSMLHWCYLGDGLIMICHDLSSSSPPAVFIWLVLSKMFSFQPCSTPRKMGGPHWLMIWSHQSLAWTPVIAFLAA